MLKRANARKLTVSPSPSIVFLDRIGTMSNWHWRRIKDPWRARGATVVFALDSWRGQLYLGTRHLGGGGELLRSDDGEQWEAVAEPGFGDPNNHDIYGLVGFRDMLYAGTYNGVYQRMKLSLPVSGGQVWRSGDGRHWKCVVGDGFGDPQNQDMFNFVEFNDHLYVGTYHAVGGAEIWRSPDGSKWVRVFKANSPQQDYIRAFAKIGQKLYASIGKLAPFVLYETSNGVNWRDTVQRQVPEHLTDGTRVAVVNDVLVAAVAKWHTGPVEMWRYHQDRWERISEPGFGVPSNVLAGGMTVHENRVVVATWNELLGTQVWICDDLRHPSWHQINESGFGEPRNAGCMFGMSSYKNNLYVGTATNDLNWESQLWVGTER